MNDLPRIVREAAEPLFGSPRDYDALLDLVGDARFVLLGEATHGTHEFYRERAEITKRLIEEKSFCAVALEADWPDAYRVNEFVRGANDDPNATAALAGFQRFPQWMWRNADVLDFVGWLREHNDGHDEEHRTGFYGLDLYSLRSSFEAVVSHLARVDPASARRARKRFGCFDQFGGDAQNYGLATGLGLSRTCEEDVINELVELRMREFDTLQRDGRMAADAFYCAEQNALVVKSAERYYRTMFHGEVSSWNLRDRHMMDTLVGLASHLEQFSHPARVVVWAHNSHVGNAHATEMSERGEFNLGQLARDRFVHHAVAIGFTTHSGTVTAASEWDEPAQRRHLLPSVPESYEMVFHLAEQPRFWLEFRKNPEVSFNLRAERLERAIGVIYRPEKELANHYFTARLPDQFDAVLHFDNTRAVEPLERRPRWKRRELQETYPTGF